MEHRQIILLLAALLIAPLPALRAAAPAEPSAKPNILIILVDDMGYSDLGCFGGEIRTPNIDGSPRAGWTFANNDWTGTPTNCRSNSARAISPTSAAASR